MREPTRSLWYRGTAPNGPGTLLQLGALVRAFIGPDPDSGLPPTSVQTLFLLDTGASRTFVKQSWLDRVVGPAALDISPVSTEQILAFHGELVDCLIYELAVTLPMTEEDGSEVHQMVFPAEIAGFPAHNEGRLHVHGLLGRDFLACMNLVYDGPSETFRMADSRHVAKFAK